MAANEDIFASSGPLTLCLSAFAIVVQFLVISVSVNNDSYYADPVRLFTVPPSSLFTQLNVHWTSHKNGTMRGTRGDFLTHQAKEFGIVAINPTHTQTCSPRLERMLFSVIRLIFSSLAAGTHIAMILP